MATNNFIECPSCKCKIDVSEVLRNQIQEQLQKDFAQKSAEKDNLLKKQLEQFEAEKKKFDEEKNRQNELVEKQTREKLKEEKAKLEISLRKKIEDESADALKALNDELRRKSDQVKELNKTKIEIEQLKREKDELGDKISLEKEKEFTNKLENERKQIAQKVEDQYLLKTKELEEKLKKQIELAEEMKRKAEQGSMQAQGEIQELAIEQFLRETFPTDQISEVPKGIKGADAIHKVVNQYGKEYGTILYESKRTKTFGKDWISKLKSDALLVKADICVIVTQTMPNENEHIVQLDGVWVCHFSDFKSMVVVLRENLIRISEAYSSQTNKGEKMQMLYDYLTGNEFRMQIEAVVNGFNELRTGYEKERQAMEKIWATREKQLTRVLLNANHFIGSVQGIAGSSLRDIKLIEQSDEEKE